MREAGRFTRMGGVGFKRGAGPRRFARPAPVGLRGPISGVALCAIPLVVFAFGLLARVAIAFLQLTQELVAFAGDLVPVVVRQFPPFFTHFPLHLLPLAFELVRVHFDTSRSKLCTPATSGTFRTPFLERALLRVFSVSWWIALLLLTAGQGPVSPSAQNADRPSETANRLAPQTRAGQIDMAREQKAATLTPEMSLKAERVLQKIEDDRIIARIFGGAGGFRPKIGGMIT